MNEENGIKVITEHEEQLQRTMCTSDVKLLDRLLADDLLFTNHEGRSLTKQQDLDLHRSGLFKLELFESSQREIRVFGNVAVVVVKIQLAGKFDGSHFAGTFRFTRVWALQESGWEITVAHSCTANE